MDERGCDWMASQLVCAKYFAMTALLRPQPMSDDTNPWQTLSQQVAYDNPWLEVQHREVINPAGKLGIYGVVHFKNRAIGVIPVDTDGYTYIVGQYRYVLEQYSWEIPEGGGPHDEDPLEAAKRELKEETGLEADHWQLIQTLHLSNSVSDEVSMIYLAQGLHPGKAEPEETEQLRAVRIPFAELYQRVLSGEITDAITVAGVLRAKLILDSSGDIGA